MANRLKMAKIDAVLYLHQQNWSIRRIAKELGISRQAVTRYIRLRRPVTRKNLELTGQERRKFAYGWIVRRIFGS